MERNEKVKIVSLPKIEDDRGNLSFFENNSQIPFEIVRTYWIYDVPGGEIRGGHAFKQQQEFIVCLSGSVDVIISKADCEKTTYSLNRSYQGLYIPNGYWRHMENFSTNTLVLVVSDQKYDENDYVREWSEYSNQNL